QSYRPSSIEWTSKAVSSTLPSPSLAVVIEPLTSEVFHPSSSRTHKRNLKYPLDPPSQSIDRRRFKDDLSPSLFCFLV
ncbi:hypothetical protein PFISCL1PPCAC_18911, partial [Pristionchus fissidentatus]